MTTTTLMAGYGDLDEVDEVGIEEALVMDEVADQEYRVAQADAFQSLRVRTDLDLDDIGHLAAIESLTNL